MCAHGICGGLIQAYFLYCASTGFLEQCFNHKTQGTDAIGGTEVVRRMLTVSGVDAHVMYWRGAAYKHLSHGSFSVVLPIEVKNEGVGDLHCCFQV